MVTLQRLVEKQEKKQTVDTICGRIAAVSVVLLIIMLMGCLFFNAHIMYVIIPFSLSLVLCGICFVTCSQVNNTTAEIIQSIERILEHTLSKHFTKNDFVFIECIKQTDRDLYFLITVFDEELSYEDLAILVRPVEQEINEIIHENLYVCYHVDNME